MSCPDFRKTITLNAEEHAAITWLLEEYHGENNPDLRNIIKKLRASGPANKNEYIKLKLQQAQEILAEISKVV